MSKKDFLNISDIPNDRYLETIVGELRRFHTFNLTHFVPRNMTYSYTFGMLIKVTGKCVECGSAVTFVTTRKMLGLQTFCRDCFRPVLFNLYELQEFNGHYRYLCTELRKAGRLAIIGTKTEAISVLKYDYFKLNYRSLAAFVEIDKNASGISDFCHLPRVRLEALADVRPDTVLIVDDPFGNAELKVRTFYLKKKLQPPHILHLLPDEKRPFAPLVKFIKGHSAATIRDKILVFSAIQIPLLIADTKAWFLTMLKSHYEALNKNVFTRRLLEKVRR